MNNILAENLLRFGVKNLKESDKQKLMEQDPKAGKMTPEQAKAFDDYIAKTFVFILRVLFEFFKIIYSSTIFPENVVSVSS